MTISIRPLREQDRDNWFRMWAAFLEFYNASLPAEVTENTWRRLTDAEDPTLFCLIAEQDGQAIGFANCVLHYTTWGIQQRCYLNDLYVDPAVRGSGAGHALIQRLREMAAEHGWEKVYWLTAQDNARARRLYDRFAPASGFIHYTVDPERA